MKVQIEFYGGNPDATQISVDLRIQRELMKNWSSAYDTVGDQPGWIQELFEIPGVNQVTVKMYEVVLHKAKLFSWNDVLPRALPIIGNHLDPDHPLEILPIVGTNRLGEDYQRILEIDRTNPNIGDDSSES